MQVTRGRKTCAVCVAFELFKTNFKLKDKSTFIKKFTYSTREFCQVSVKSSNYITSSPYLRVYLNH